MSEDKKKSDSKLSLSAKADKFDVSLSTLKKVYKRGVAAWNSGHRPGTTPQQWGHARVNSFLRKGKTYHTADKDLRENLVIERLQLVPPTPEEEDDYMNRVRNNWDKGMNDDDAYREATRETGVGYYRDQMWKMVDGMRPLNKIPTKVGDHPASSFVNKNLLNRVSKLKDINVNVIDDFDQRYPDAAGEQVITYADPKTNKLRSRPFDINISLDPKVMTKSSGMRSVIPNQNIVAHGFQHVADALGGQDAGNSNDSWFDLDRERIAHLTGRWFDMSPEERKNKVWTDTAAEIDAEMDRAAAAQKSIEARRSRNNSTSSEAPEPLNELKKDTMQSYLEKRPSVKIKDVIAARAAEKAGDESPIYRLAKIQKGRRRAQNKINKIDAQAAAAERQRKIASGEITAADLEREHLNLHHPYAPRVPGVPDKPGSRYWGDHVEHDADINQLFERLIFTDADEGQIQSARELQSTGTSKEEIWQKTGAFQHPQTGRWLQEPISDDKLELPGYKQQGVLSDLGVGKQPQPTDWNAAANVVKHDQLFKKFPQLSGLPTIARSLTPGQALSTSQRGRFTSWGGRSTGGIQVMSPTESGAKDAMVHELQHAVQYAQGREGGANPQQFKNQGSGDFMSQVKYYMDPGENEARAAAARRTLTPQERKERYPGKDFGIANIFEDEQLDEMQLMGTDEYRQHAIAMTPGQNQEIEDAFPPEVYGYAVPQNDIESEETEESENRKEVNEQSGSGNNENDGVSFKNIRKYFSEQEELENEEEVEEDEYEEEETEDDGVEDGVDFTPSLKTRKIKNKTGVEYTGATNNGLPVLGISEGDVVPFRTKKAATKNDTLNSNARPVPNNVEKLPSKVTARQVATKALGYAFIPGWYNLAKDAAGLVGTSPDASPEEIMNTQIDRSAFAHGAGIDPRGLQYLLHNTEAGKKLKGMLAKWGDSPDIPDPLNPVWGAVFNPLSPIEGAKAGWQETKDQWEKLKQSATGNKPKDEGEYTIDLTKINESFVKELAKRILQRKGNVTKVNFRPEKSPEELATSAARSRQIMPLRNEPPIDFKKQSELLMGRRPFPTVPMNKSKKWEPESFDEAVEYHAQNNLSLVENVYRPGSEMFFAMILEAKRLYSEGKLTPKDEYEKDLLESDIGEVAEYEGRPVLLDYPYEEQELNEEDDPTRGKGIGKPFRSRGGGAVYVRNEKGNVIKVNFSQSGMKKRFNEPARVKSFVARHNCYGNKDKTSASYWACRWPRYFSDSGQKWW